MGYERDEAGRMQDATEAMIRMRQPTQTVRLTRRSVEDQMRYALEQIREQAATKPNGGAWAAGVATLCLATLSGSRQDKHMDELDDSAFTDGEAEDWIEEELEEDREADCGRWDNGRLVHQCRLAGSEWCDWECPIGLPTR